MLNTRPHERTGSEFIPTGTPGSDQEEVLQTQSVFSPGAAVVRDEAHVWVERVLERGADGQTITFYRKKFKWEGWDIWSERESCFLGQFHGHRLKHVVQMRKLETSTPGVVSAVDTYDAGITIEDWRTVEARYADGTTFNHPFRRGEDFLRLMRACLAALKEIHDVGIVHCDFKADNICLPYVPRPYTPGVPLKLDFAAIRLIDFSFSIGRDLPLEHILPIKPTGDYQSPLLQAALKADHQSKRPDKAATLDYRVDLYGLGYLGSQIMASGSFFWDKEERGASGKALIREVIEELKDLGSGRRRLRKLFSGGRPHQRLLKKLDDWLKGARPQEAFVPTVQAVLGEAAATPWRTPITPVIEEAVVGRDFSRHSGHVGINSDPVRS
jgi:hypothetical protein